ncbi:CBS domain-containing protein [Flammeovirga yaeyamensis]|uniref:CBS domain-containing protein n=1 Tax=Flammeovirga yaeyamensis TaxID=367791 RepID=A0AAX1N3X4_9BACT|nr:MULTISPECIES: CBS domain-containing protein [Flammeovirga]ANQ47989.1 CBS domain-containing protein [Flammeovirga sp. MY04]MBB3700848.1 CBS domain-containing protein [Flammeovirga yaeyamensis]NMF37956.1 CBS domain-containing protein [Flammeovirga yaeyamensis]QWG00608.1 CBS domain-containing protein [Flammeovirga yaeyamensis]
MNFTPKRLIEDPHDVKPYPSVDQYMTKKLIVFKPDQFIEEAMEVLVEKKISGAPVINDEGDLVGMLSEKDCLHIVLESRYLNFPASQGRVKDYMTKAVMSITPDRDVVEVAMLFKNSSYRRYPIVKKGKLIGQVSRRDILRAAIDLKSTTW